jgi:quercetin dioxygenase-like cupin family protein
MTVETENLKDLNTASLHSTATDDAVWVGGYFSFGGRKAEDSCTIYFGIPPGDRLGKHVDTAEETQYILSGSGDLLLDDGAKPIKPGDVFVLNEGVSHDLHNTGSEELCVLAFFSKPKVEQHWDIETWPPDNTKVTGSPNRG